MERTGNIFVLVLWVAALVTPVISLDASDCDMICCDLNVVSCPASSLAECTTGEATAPIQPEPGTLVEFPSTKVIMAIEIAMPVATAIVLDGPKTTILSEHTCSAAAHTLPLLV